MCRRTYDIGYTTSPEIRKPGQEGIAALCLTKSLTEDLHKIQEIEKIEEPRRSLYDVTGDGIDIVSIYNILLTAYLPIATYKLKKI